MPIESINGTAFADIEKFSGVAKADIVKLNGSDAPASGFSNTKSLFTDGVNDFFKATLSSDIVNTDTGSISFWVKIASNETGTSRYLTLYDASNSGSDRIDLLFFNTSNSPQARAILGNYRQGTTNKIIDAKTGSSFHGRPFARRSSEYGDFGAGGSDHVYQAGLSQNNWNHIVLTWDTGESFSYGGRTYSGSMRLYFNGTLVNHGQSTFPSHNGVGTSIGIGSFSASTVIDTIQIGTNHVGTSPLDANTDEVAVFDSVLSSSDVTSIYNSGSPGDLSSYSNLIGWWRFEDNGNDSSSNSNSGTLSNGASYSSTIPS